MRFRYSLVALAFLPAIIQANTTAADRATFDTIDKVTNSKSTQIESMALQISEKLKGVGQAQIQANSAMTAYQEKQRILHALNDMSAELEQPTNNCEKVRSGAKSGAFATMSRSETIIGSNNASKSAYLNARGSVSEIKAYEDNVRRFCNMQQQANGLCHFAGSQDLIDGDMNSSTLFGSNGDVTRTVEQNLAMSATIQHLTGEDYLLPPHAIKESVDESGLYMEDVVLDSLPSQVQQYENIRRRHSAVIGLVTDGLLTVSNNHTFMPVNISNYSNSQIERDTEDRYPDPMNGQSHAGNEQNNSPYLITNDHIDPNSRPAMLAEYAFHKTGYYSRGYAQQKNRPHLEGQRKDSNQSLGYCASYVADALIYGGKFNYSRPASAYQAGPRLEQIGYKRIPLNSKPQVGDILVLQPHGIASGGKPCSESGCMHGHIQIYTGIKGGLWVSDYRQNNGRLFNVPSDYYLNPKVGKALYRHNSVM